MRRSSAPASQADCGREANKAAMEDNLVDEYVYEALPDPQLCVRLLTIRPSARFDDPIICNITIVRLASSRRILNSPTKIFRSTEYTALSYCWGMNEDGDAMLNRTITIEGKRKLVTRNLFEGLLRIRRRTYGVAFPTLTSNPQEKIVSRIWIDAISINQKDPNERSSQVLIMDKIYRHACHLLVWLGEGDTPIEDSEVLALLRCMSSKHCRRLDMTYRLPLDLQSVFENGTGIGTELSALYDELVKRHTIFRDANTAIPTMLKTMGLLHRFVTRRSKRYFSRRWIVQELLYGREQADCYIYWGPVRCSDYVFSTGLREAEWFCNFVKCTPELEWRDPPPRMWVQDMSHLLPIADLVELLPSRLQRQRKPTLLHRIMMPIMTHRARLNHRRINNIRTDRPRRNGHIGDRLPISTEVVGFLDALRRFHYSQCSDTRDTLYALASLDPSFGLIANYSRSIEEVFTDLARILVETNKCDEVLLNLAAAIHQAHARPNQRRPLQILDLPSWVPDFRAPFRDPGNESSYMYEASTIDECILKCTLDQVAVVVSIRDVMVDVEFQTDPDMDMESTPRRAGYPFWELRGSIPEEVFDSMDAFYRRGDKFCRIGHSTNNLLVLRPCDDTSEYHTITNVIGSISSDTRDVPTFSWAPGRATGFKIR